MRFRLAFKLPWHPWKMSYSSRNNYAPRFEKRSVIQGHLEPRPVLLHLSDLSTLQVRQSLLLIPPSIVDKVLEGNGLLKFGARVCLEMIKRQLGARIGDVRGSPIGAKIHSGRHVISPETHRIAEDSNANPFVLQISTG